jgi:hypothetical protein
LYDCNHQDVKLRWEMFLNRVDEIYIIEYAIADRSDKLSLHLKIWDSHDKVQGSPRELSKYQTLHMHTNITNIPL